jgi:aspartate kinase
MSLIVQKFGGSSVGDIDRIKRVTHIVAKTRAAGHDVVVVVSAMEGETDRLLNLAGEAVLEPNAREMDALVATGEQVSAALLSMSLISLQCPARSYTGSQVMIETKGSHRKAIIKDIKTDNLLADLSEGRVPVVTGFQGINADGHITTIGRGGSDITAVTLAAALKADECQVYTDVDGIYTSDPQVVKEARLLSQITFDEMIELAALGAKVLHSQAVKFAHRYRVPLRVLSTFKDGEGTLLTFADEEHLMPTVSGIAFDPNQAKLTIIGLPSSSKTLSQVMSALNQADIDVDMMIQNVPSSQMQLDFSFTVPREAYPKALTVTESIAKVLSAQAVHGDDKIAKLSIVGLGMKSHAGAASKMLQTLAEEGIATHLISSSEIKISAVVDEKYLELGARALHAAFDLEKKPKNQQDKS